ncbi:hypothetical protein EOA13_35895 [Mesorhizobium sp. M7A.F.Ca.US.011.01.1.1]|uniref:hypothetical protein n=1 Tax=unclassified Mesorhizobium TaxID=325217 RepID=UPI000FCB34CE|nr:MULTISPECIES: hypothetical protein [unclassified Mesorhizobium]RUW89872.1 hypothetical protein EOA19_22870 [Mesorhizobium sp. M7A.F.Ca.US.010.02.1.1]RUX22575.1 hypothetical protein EOA13_35895 [Mesorhizobium sp. M7A.F.Ca.US.011.01.1.1]
MSTPAQIRLAYLMSQLAHTESILSKQDIIVGLLDHEGSPTADAMQLLADMHHLLQRTRKSLYAETAART